MVIGTPQLDRKKGWIAALAIAITSLLVRLPNIFTWWLNPDEGIYYSILTWTDSTQFWTEMVNNAHPPLYYLVTRAIGTLTTDFIVIRSLSLIFGSIAIVAAWMVGKEIVSAEPGARSIGIVSALILALSPNVTTMSQVMRPYAMVLALLLLTLYSLLRYRKSKSARHLVWYSVLLSLALFTHYSAFLAFGVFGILVLGDFITRNVGRRDIAPLLAAHAAPALICVGLYLFHLRPHLLGSALAAEALESWLAPYMVYSVWDVAARLYGFMGYLVSGMLAGPASLLWFAGLAISLRKRHWTILLLSLAAVGVATFAASLGKYPFGPCRHDTWLSTFLVFPISLVLVQMATQKGRSKVVAFSLIAFLVAVGLVFDDVVGKTRTHTSALGEQVIKMADVEVFQRHLSAGTVPNKLLINAQTYYVLMPLYVAEKQTQESSPDGTFFHFRWESRDVIVVNSWNFSARREDIGEHNHLYTLVQTVDRLMPQLELGDQHEVLMVFGGWYDETPSRLINADQSLPENARLISNKKEAPGLSTFTIDLARYQLLMKEALKRKLP